MSQCWRVRKLELNSRSGFCYLWRCWHVSRRNFREKNKRNNYREGKWNWIMGRENKGPFKQSHEHIVLQPIYQKKHKRYLFVTPCLCQSGGNASFLFHCSINTPQNKMSWFTFIALAESETQRKTETHRSLQSEWMRCRVLFLTKKKKMGQANRPACPFNRPESRIFKVVEWTPVLQRL